MVHTQVYLPPKPSVALEPHPNEGECLKSGTKIQSYLDADRSQSKENSDFAEMRPCTDEFSSHRELAGKARAQQNTGPILTIVLITSPALV